MQAPLSLKRNLKLPQEHYEICKSANIPTIGNAAGNSMDWFNLKGENAPPAPLPAGFTTKGIIALIFSIITGILGTIVIFWYSLGEEGGAPAEEEGREGLLAGEDEDMSGVVGGRVPDETVSLLRN